MGREVAAAVSVVFAGHVAVAGLIRRLRSTHCGATARRRRYWPGSAAGPSATALRDWAARVRLPAGSPGAATIAQQDDATRAPACPNRSRASLGDPASILGALAVEQPLIFHIAASDQTQRCEGADAAPLSDCVLHAQDRLQGLCR